MNLTSRTIFIISGDLALAQRCFEELAAFGGRYRTHGCRHGGAGAEEDWPERSRGRVSGRIRDRNRRMAARRWNPRSHC